MAAWSALVACFVASRALELLELQIDGPPTVRVLYDDACARGAVVDELLDHFAMSAEARARTRAGGPPGRAPGHLPFHRQAHGAGEGRQGRGARSQDRRRREALA